MYEGEAEGELEEGDDAGTYSVDMDGGMPTSSQGQVDGRMAIEAPPLNVRRLKSEQSLPLESPSKRLDALAGGCAQWFGMGWFGLLMRMHASACWCLLHDPNHLQDGQCTVST